MLHTVQGFEGFLGNIFSPRHEVYFVSWAWDLSGEPPFLHPEADTDPRSVLIPMRVGKVRQFLGDGVLLFPERPVTGGLAVRILLWESDSDVRTLAKTLFSVASTLKNGNFSSLLTTLAGITSVPTATLAAIAKGALELASAVSSVLQGNGDDYVDFYEGYFAAGHPWKRDEQTYSGEASKIVIART